MYEPIAIKLDSDPFGGKIEIEKVIASQTGYRVVPKNDKKYSELHVEQSTGILRFTLKADSNVNLTFKPHEWDWFTGEGHRRVLARWLLARMYQIQQYTKGLFQHSHAFRGMFAAHRTLYLAVTGHESESMRERALQAWGTCVSDYIESVLDEAFEGESWKYEYRQRLEQEYFQKLHHMFKVIPGAERNFIFERVTLPNQK